MILPVFRTEVEKQVRRLRTLVAFLVAAGVPVLIALAVNARPPRNAARNPERAAGLFRLAQHSGPVLSATALSVMSGLLLVVIVAMFAGDTIAGEASWGSLRYILLRPVGRLRLLFSKLAVTLLLTWAVTIVAAASGLIAGIAFFGYNGIDIPIVGVHQSAGLLVWHLLIGTAYVSWGFTAAVGLGLLFSTMTDTPSGAIGGAIGVYIVSEIMDGIDTLGRLRYAFPTHYIDTWQQMFTQDKIPHDMVAGILVQGAWLVVTVGLAAWWFRRKDIRS